MGVRVGKTSTGQVETLPRETVVTMRRTAGRALRAFQHAHPLNTASSSPLATTSRLTIEQLQATLSESDPPSAAGTRSRALRQHHQQRYFSQTTRSARDAPQQDQERPQVSEELLRKYAEAPPAYVTIQDLTGYGRPPLSEQALIESAEATRAELPHRLARRVLAHRSLPFIVGRNPYIAQVYNLYESSFATLSAVPPIRSLADNEAFTRTLDQLVADHSNNVPILAKGFSECKDYLSAEDISIFFDRAIRNRIGIRLMAEQHLAVTYISDPKLKSKVSPTDIGIVDTRCSPAKLIRSCGYHVESLCEGAYGKSPDLRITGDTSVTFSYIPTHIEYVLNELLKNAFRATCEHHSEKSHNDLPPVVATIAKSPNAPVITIRIRDVGGGIPPEILPKATSYAFTTVSNGGTTASGEEIEGDHRDEGPYGIQNAGGGVGLDEIGGVSSDSGHLAGLGFGLPLSKLHCEYFGGSLELVSLYGHGTDAFMVLKGEDPQ